LKRLAITRAGEATSIGVGEATFRLFGWACGNPFATEVRGFNPVTVTTTNGRVTSPSVSLAAASLAATNLTSTILGLSDSKRCNDSKNEQDSGHFSLQVRTYVVHRP
jgi:hypothetical protein